MVEAAGSRCFGGGPWMVEMVVGVWSEGVRRKEALGRCFGAVCMAGVADSRCFEVGLRIESARRLLLQNGWRVKAGGLCSGGWRLVHKKSVAVW